MKDATNILGTSHQYSRTEADVDTFTLKVKMDRRIVSKAQLLVYYVLPVSGEVVVGGTDISVEKCLPNKVRCNITLISYDDDFKIIVVIIILYQRLSNT